MTKGLTTFCSSLEGLDAIGRVASKAPNLRPARERTRRANNQVKRKESQSAECPGCTSLVVVVVSGERTQGVTTAKFQRIRKNLILHHDVVSNFFSG